MFLSAIAYLLLPTIIFVSAFSDRSAILLISIGMLASTYSVYKSSVKVIATPTTREWAPFVSVGILAVFLSGIIPPLAQNSDWPKHYALFNLMTEQVWPPKVDIDGISYTLRYPLAWYTVPSLVGGVIGRWSVPYAAFAWTTLGLVIALRLSFQNMENRWQKIVACLIFLLFSGADIVGYAVTNFSIGPAFHIEWWAGFAESPSNITSLFWTPQHALPAWIGTALFLRYPTRSARSGIIIATAIAGWSPFVLIGMLPVTIISLIRCGIRQAFSPQNFTALLIFVPTATFLVQETGSLPTGMGWNDQHFSAHKYLAFVVLEFGMIGAAIVWINRSALPPIVMCLLFLTALALTRVGEYNDLMMRGSLPALCVLAILAAETVIKNKIRTTAPLLVLLAIGALVPLGEIARGFVDDRITSPEQITIQQGAFSNPKLLAQYLVKTGPQAPD